MTCEMFGCQCEYCQKLRAYREHSDPMFDAAIEQMVRERVNPMRPLPPVADEWASFLANVRAGIKFIAAAMRSLTSVRLN